MRGLERDPAKRFATAREMAIAIEQSTPLASASEVGAWVSALSRDVIDERARRVAEIESDAMPARPNAGASLAVGVRGRESPPAYVGAPAEPQVLTGTFPGTAPANGATTLPLASTPLPSSAPSAAGAPPAIPAPRASRGLVAASIVALFVASVLLPVFVVRARRADRSDDAGAAVQGPLASATAPLGSAPPALSNATSQATLSLTAREATAPSASAVTPLPGPATSGPATSRSRMRMRPTQPRWPSAVDPCDPPYERAADGKLVPKAGCL
jgi:serine/threonine-protein kinase